MKFQIGKNGVNEGTISSLALAFKTHQVVRISVLRSLAPTKDKAREIADEIAGKLEGKYKYSIIGFTIIMRKQKAGAHKLYKSSFL